MSKHIPLSPKPRRRDPEQFVTGTSRPPKKRLTIDIDPELHRRMKTRAAERGTRMADDLRALLEQEYAS